MKALSVKNIEHGENNPKKKITCWCKAICVLDHKIEKGEAPWSSQEAPTHCAIKQNLKENRNILDRENNLENIEHGEHQVLKRLNVREKHNKKWEKKKTYQCRYGPTLS